MNIEAPERGRFCRVLADARRYKLPGYWEGSAYRHHPCGVVRHGIILTNDWHVNDHCDAKVMLAPTSPLADRCQNSCANGDPSARPKRGNTILVYRDGRWKDDDGPWRQVIVDILCELEDEIASAKADEKAECEQKARAAKDEHDRVLEEARLIFSREENQ